MRDIANTAQELQARQRANRALIQKYAIAVLATALALAARLTMGTMISKLTPFTLFVPAVMLSAWFGGMGPGVLATVAGTILGNYFLIGPGHEFDLDLSAAFRTLLFLLVGLQISWLSGQMHAARRRAEADAADARDNERLYRALASNFPEGFVCLLDASLRGTLAGAGLTTAGLASEPDAKPLQDLFPAATVSQLEPLCREALQGRSASADLRHLDRVYAAHLLPLPELTRGAHACLGIFEDITDRVRAIEQLQWARAHLEQRVSERTAELHFQKGLLEAQNQASLDGILAVSQSGQIIFANRRFRSLWGLSEAAMTLADVRHVLRRQLTDYRDLLTLETTPEDPPADESFDELALRDGRSIEYLHAPIIDPGGNYFGRVWFFRNITERKRLQQQILQAGEHERQRIGQDLHDDLCQQLTGIAYAGRLLHQKLSLLRIPAELSLAASNIVHMLQRANERARDLAQGLHPIQLQRKGLDAALQELAINVGVMYEIECRFRGAEQPLPLDDDTALHLYRITQEAISNAVRHGKARHVQVDLVTVEHRLILSIEDDGLGFTEPAPGHGLGLETMSYRARMVGGTFAIESGQNQGTSVTVCVPLALHASTRNADHSHAPEI